MALDINTNIYEHAVSYAAMVLVTAEDWQQAQHMLADHPEYGPWLSAGGDPVGDSQAIIRDAEARLASRLRRG